MAIEIEGKLIKVLPEVSGQGSSGTWIKQLFVIETREQYPKKVCFTAWGDKVDAVKRLEEGEDIKVSFNAESREFNEKWYTDLRAWKIEKLGATAKVNTTVTSNVNVKPPITETISDFPAEEQGDDLPF